MPRGRVTRGFTGVAIKAGPLPAHAPVGVRYGSPGPCSGTALARVPRSDLVRTDGCNATSPEIRARSFAHSRGAGQVVICDRLSWIWSAGRWPAHRAHRRATLLPATAPRSDAEPARHFRPAGASTAVRLRAAPTSRFPGVDAAEAVPRGRVTRGFTASRTTARRCRAGALRSSVALHSRTMRVQANGLRTSVAPSSPCENAITEAAERLRAACTSMRRYQGARVQANGLRTSVAPTHHARTPSPRRRGCRPTACAPAWHHPCENAITSRGNPLPLGITPTNENGRPKPPVLCSISTDAYAPPFGGAGGGGVPGGGNAPSSGHLSPQRHSQRPGHTQTCLQRVSYTAGIGMRRVDAGFTHTW